jgi:hypothetical protein
MISIEYKPRGSHITRISDFGIFVYSVFCSSACILYVFAKFEVVGSYSTIAFSFPAVGSLLMLRLHLDLNMLPLHGIVNFY